MTSPWNSGSTRLGWLAALSHTDIRDALSVQKSANFSSHKWHQIPILSSSSLPWENDVAASEGYTTIACWTPQELRSFSSFRWIACKTLAAGASPSPWSGYTFFSCSVSSDVLVTRFELSFIVDPKDRKMDVSREIYWLFGQAGL